MVKYVITHNRKDVYLMPRKTVLVTGASRGIGKAVAVKFAKKGYNVAISCVHREEQLMQTRKEIESFQVPCLAYKGDMGDMACCEELFLKIKKMFGGVDVLVNNAGISYIGLLQDMTPADWERMLRTNLTSVFNCPLYDFSEAGKNCQYIFCMGRCGRLLRDSLLSHQRRYQRPDKGPGKGAGPQQYPGQCNCLRSH